MEEITRKRRESANPSFSAEGDVATSILSLEASKRSSIVLSNQDGVGDDASRRASISMTSFIKAFDATTTSVQSARSLVGLSPQPQNPPSPVPEGGRRGTALSRQSSRSTSKMVHWLEEGGEKRGRKSVESSSDTTVAAEGEENPFTASDEYEGGEQHIASIAELFDLFSRLRDDENFEDWLQLGIPTTIDQDEDGDLDDTEEERRENLKRQVEEMRQEAREYERKKRETQRKTELENGEGKSSPTTSAFENERELDHVISGGVGARNRRMSEAGFSQSARGIMGFFETEQDLFTYAEAPRDDFAAQTYRSINRFKRIRDVRTTTAGEYQGGEESAADTWRASVNQPGKFRRPPVVPGFSFIKFHSIIEQKIDNMMATLDEISQKGFAHHHIALGDENSGRHAGPCHASPLREPIKKRCAEPHPLGDISSYSEYVIVAQQLLDILTEGRSTRADEALAEECVDMAQELSAKSFAADLLLQYTEAFLNAQFARNYLDADLREDILAKGVKLRAHLGNMVSIGLALTSRLQDIDSFGAFKEQVEGQVKDSVSPFVELINTSYDNTEFPDRRARLRKVQVEVQDRLNTAMKAIQEVEHCTDFSINTHQEWKLNLIDSSLREIHTASHVWESMSMGFIDADVAHQQAVIYDETGLLAKVVRVPMRKRIKFLRCTERWTFVEIARYVKQGRGTEPVGLQMCMSARWLLEEQSDEHDDEWGFSM